MKKSRDESTLFLLFKIKNILFYDTLRFNFWLRFVLRIID